MKEILLTSSVLILALLLLRLLFRKTISRQVQYALWGLVALRLLVPVSLPAMEHNVLTAAEPVTARITAPALYVTPYRETIVSAPPGVFQTPDGLPGAPGAFEDDGGDGGRLCLPGGCRHLFWPSGRSFHNPDAPGGGGIAGPFSRMPGASGKPFPA